MIDFFKFAWRCIKQAWRGCWTKANEAAAVIGGGVLAVVLFLLRSWLIKMNWIEAPTTVSGVTAFGVAVAIASLLLAFLVIFSGRLIIAPARLYWEQHRKADTLEAELSAIQASPDSGPNWPIHEVFSYLEPEVLDRPQDNLWQKAGDKIRDALSLGQLTAWGRPYKTKLGDWVGERAALRIIDKEYWEKAFFTYFFFDATAKDQTHCYADRDTGRPAYTDLQVNRAEVLKLWPGEPNDLAENYPNVRVADDSGVVELFDGSERAKLIALLESEKLMSWARRSADIGTDLIRLDGKTWTSHSLRFMAKTPDAGTINQTFLRARGSQNSTFYDVCLNYAQLKRAWPSLNIHRSKCDVL